jgi:hypothetical protein
MRVEVGKLPAYADRFGNRPGRVASSYLLAMNRASKNGTMLKVLFCNLTSNAGSQIAE